MKEMVPLPVIGLKKRDKILNNYISIQYSYTFISPRNSISIKYLSGSSL